MSNRRATLRSRLSWLLLTTLGLATLGLSSSLQADAHRSHPLVTPAPPAAARDGILGSSVGHARAHAGLGGPATPKPVTMGSVNLKQHH